MAYRDAARAVAGPRYLGGPQHSAAWAHRAGSVLCRNRLHGFIAWLRKEVAAYNDAGEWISDQTEERGKGVKRKNIGSSFDSWLREEGIYEEVSATAVKRVLARQVEAAMQQKGFTKTEMARRMHTSRAALDRLLDP